MRGLAPRWDALLWVGRKGNASRLGGMALRKGIVKVPRVLKSNFKGQAQCIIGPR